MVSFEPTHYCWICGKAVSLESCKDEQGNPVHERCYAAKLALDAGMLNRPIQAHRRHSFGDAR